MLGDGRGEPVARREEEAMATTPKPDAIERRATEAFERVAKTAERVGIPIATFAVGAVTLWLSTLSKMANITVLPWLGSALILASLATYVWLTERSTIRVQSPTAPIPTELKEVMDWMRGEIEKQGDWARNQLKKPEGPAISRRSQEG